MLRFILFAFALLLYVQPLYAQSTLSFDASHRMRFVGWDKGLGGSYGTPIQFTTNRTRAGLTWRPAAALELRAAVVNEFYDWIEYPTERPFEIDELAFEHLYLRWKDTIGIPVSATIGRQNMTFGEGFVLFEGGPLDGSRTIYVNGARADVEPAAGQRITALYLYQPRTDDLLPIINDQSRRLAEYSREIGGVYYDGHLFGIGVNAYMLYSKGGWFPWVHRARYADNQISSLTSGIRLDYKNANGLQMQGEIAYQRSELSETGWEWKYDPPAGLATYARVGWSDVRQQLAGLSAHVGVFHYNEEWEPLLGRWPKWNESLVYSRDILAAPGFWYNIQAAFIELSIEPLSSLRIVAKYQALGNVDHIISQTQPGTSSPDIGGLLAFYCFWKPDLPLSANIMIERMEYSDGFIEALHGTIPNSYFWGRMEVAIALSELTLID